MSINQFNNIVQAPEAPQALPESIPVSDKPTSDKVARVASLVLNPKIPDQRHGDLESSKPRQDKISERKPALSMSIDDEDEFGERLPFDRLPEPKQPTPIYVDDADLIPRVLDIAPEPRPTTPIPIDDEDVSAGELLFLNRLPEPKPPEPRPMTPICNDD